MNFHRPATWLGSAILLLVSGGLSFGQTAEQLSGYVSSVDVDGKKIVVTPKDKEKTTDVVVNDKTEIVTQGGNAFALKDLKAGDGLGIAIANGVATKIIVAVKPSELTGHVKTVKSDAKTFVVTETGTTTEVTVAITKDTSIVDVKGNKLELKELKKGDGVGICHFNSVATKILVNVKPTSSASASE
jgi:hypothetical protein